MAPCERCGLDELELPIGDAFDAFRSFPRRFTEAVAGVDDAALRVRFSPEVWSIVEYLVHVREVFELLAMSIPLVLERPGVSFPNIDLPEIDVGEASASRPEWVMDRNLALDGITRACAQFLGFADQSAEAWERSFTLGDAAHDAGWILRHAAHEGVHHLRDIAFVRAAVG